MNFKNQFLTGFRFFIIGFQALRKVPGAFLWALIPFLIDLILVFLFLSWGFGSLGAWITSAIGVFLSSSSGFLFSLIFYPLYALFGFGFFVLIIYAVFLVSTFIAAPFNAVLAEKVLVHAGVLEERTFEWNSWVRSNLKMLFAAIKRTFLLLSLGIVILLLSFLPGLNIISSFLACLVVSYDSSDYAFEALLWNNSQRYHFFRKHFNMYAGEASSIALSLLLPGATALLLPIMVLGSSTLIAEHLKLTKQEASSAKPNS